MSIAERKSQSVNREQQVPWRRASRFLLAMCIVLAASSIRAQDDQKDPIERLMRDRAVPTSDAVTPQPGIALDGTVDPAHYVLGPADLLGVNIWISPPQNYLLTVTPEGTLIIPMVGEVAVSGVSLAEAKSRIIEEIRKKYRTQDITATLIRPRSIIVSISGNVLNPGLYTVLATDRATKMLEVANKLAPTQTPGDLERINRTMSTRNIVIKHRDGTSVRVDIPRYTAMMENVWNPYLREGDVVIVPRKDEHRNVFGIYGEVNAPGTYEFVRGDSIIDAVSIAQGITRLALVDSIEFSRLSRDGTQMTTSVLNLREIVGGSTQDIALEPGDRIVVKPRVELRQDYKVHVEGEVLYPGTYPITKNRTKLLDVLRMAGGLTEFAALKSAELNRRSVEPEGLQVERLLSFRGGVSSEDSIDYNLETELRLRKEIVNVDFERLMHDNDSTQDVIVQDEDRIVVPSVKRSIYVFGQIVSPGHIPFLPGEGVQYYVRKAGGFTERARDSDLKIIKGKTKQWLAPDETTIEDGDYIWVPKDPDRPFGYYMTIASQMASVMSVIVGIAVVIVQVTQ